MRLLAVYHITFINLAEYLAMNICQITVEGSFYSPSIRKYTGRLRHYLLAILNKRIDKIKTGWAKVSAKGTFPVFLRAVKVWHWNYHIYSRNKNLPVMVGKRYFPSKYIPFKRRIVVSFDDIDFKKLVSEMIIAVSKRWENYRLFHIHEL